jgi:hypothetical protein
MTAAGLAAALHLALQVGIYALGFAAGSKADTWRVLGVSLYGIASVLTLPFVPIAERLGWSGIGLLLVPLNSIAWGGSLYLALGLAARPGGNLRDGERGHRNP